MATRRTVLTAVGAAGVLALPLAGELASAESAPARSIPRTLARRVRYGTGAARAAAPPFPLTHLGVTWTGGDGQVAIRTRSGTGWGPWRTLHVCGAGRDGRTTAGAVLPVPGAAGYEVSVRRGEASVVELNTIDGPAQGPAGAPRSQLELGGRTVPAVYLDRAAWCADESLRYTPDGVEVWPPEYSPSQTLTVHHTAGANDDPDPAATVRAIYYLQCVENGWGDIGYHLLIDEAGRVYEGRWSGSDGVPVYSLGPGTGDGLLPVVAGHVLGYNTGNVGVVLLGDLTNRQPTGAARRSLTGVLAALCVISGADPLGITDYRNPDNGNARTAHTIGGHRDYAATECPGNTFYPELPGLREDVADLIG